MIILRPKPSTQVTYIGEKEVVANTTLQAFECIKLQYLGRRGSVTGTGRVVPACTFTQNVKPHRQSPFIFDISDSGNESGSLDSGGVELSYFWQDQPPRPPPILRLGPSGWPSTLSPQALEALSGFPQNFNRTLHPAPIHGTDIAGESIQLRATHG
jgi:hypothetical protein